jgi:hypothetical protein
MIFSAAPKPRGTQPEKGTKMTTTPAHRTARSPRAMKIAGIASIPVALIVAGVLVGGASYSAFNATTSTPTNNWSAGTVALSDNDQGVALFTATNLAPGATGTKDITVTSTGSLASTVKLYGTNASTTNGLSSYIDLTITEGTGSGASFTPLASGSNVYTGTLAAFASTDTSYANGITAWAPAGGGTDARTFRINYTLEGATPNTAQAGTTALGFTWEAQNN